MGGCCRADEKQRGDVVVRMRSNGGMRSGVGMLSRLIPSTATAKLAVAVCASDRLSMRTYTGGADPLDGNGEAGR